MKQNEPDSYRNVDDGSVEVTSYILRCMYQIVLLETAVFNFKLYFLHFLNLYSHFDLTL